MGVPKSRVSSTRRDKRRAHWRARIARGMNLSPCPHCGRPRLPHHACRYCGYYGERRVMDVERRRPEE
ncbi:MAG TPA: 50S ribosomal protein L32 [Armatimonadetes bacterium]|nr:50S ribosomal protein L32 [Armatimonadota bacterium]